MAIPRAGREKLAEIHVQGLRDLHAQLSNIVTRLRSTSQSADTVWLLARRKDFESQYAKLNGFQTEHGAWFDASSIYANTPWPQVLGEAVTILDGYVTAIDNFIAANYSVDAPAEFAGLPVIAPLSAAHRTTIADRIAQDLEA